MKLCGRCGVVKHLDEFHAWSRGNRQPWCKACRKAYDAAYHQRVRERRKEQRRRRKVEILAWYRALKEAAPCVDCGRHFPHPAMQFDHLPGTEKRDDIGRLMRHSSKGLVLAEIAKCELVCANCHAIRTFRRRTADEYGRAGGPPPTPAEAAASMGGPDAHRSGRSESNR